MNCGRKVCRFDQAILNFHLLISPPEFLLNLPRTDRNCRSDHLAKLIGEHFIPEGLFEPVYRHARPRLYLIRVKVFLPHAPGPGGWQYLLDAFGFLLWGYTHTETVRLHIQSALENHLVKQLSRIEPF